MIAYPSLEPAKSTSESSRARTRRSHGRDQGSPLLRRLSCFPHNEETGLHHVSGLSVGVRDCSRPHHQRACVTVTSLYHGKDFRTFVVNRGAFTDPFAPHDARVHRLAVTPVELRVQRRSNQKA